MTTPKYTELATITTSSSVSSVTFSSIPGTYRDLYLVMLAAGTTANRYGFELNLNNDTTPSNYARLRLYFESSLFSDYSSAHVIPVLTPERSMHEIHIFDYAQTNKHKAMLVSGGGQGENSAYSSMGLMAGKWNNTGAVTSLVIREIGNASNIAGGSRFSLYGVK